MALTLADIRTYVYNHLDIEEIDLPTDVLDVFIREGSKRIEQAESRWPFYESEWSLTTEDDTRDYGMPSSDIDQVAAVNGPSWPLEWVGFDVYQRWNPRDRDVRSEPTHFAIWADRFHLYPTPDDEYTLRIRGYRLPSDWVSDGSGSQPDLPDQLHNTVATWALARAYAQQEDPEMASLYERQAINEMDVFRRRIAETPHPQPAILNGRRHDRPEGRFTRPLFSFEV